MKFYFIRHGISCANINRHIQELPDNIDPHLSKIGIEYSKKKGYSFRNGNHAQQKIVLCSAMNRAIETAMFMFPHSNIVVIPHIKERGKSNENTVENLMKKKEYFKKMYPKKFKQLDFSNITENNKNSENFEAFKQLMNSHKFKDYKTLCVVTHSLYMIKYLNVHQTPFPLNNVVYTCTSLRTPKLKILQKGATMNANVFKPKNYINCL